MPFAQIYADRLHHIADLPAPGAEYLLRPEPTPGELLFGAPFGPAEPVEVLVLDMSVPGPHGIVPVRVYTPETADVTRPALVWYHGGAFAFGGLDMPEAHRVSAGISARANAVVVSVDYRLCVDGVHHPIPHDDSYAAYRWVLDNVTKLGIEPQKVAVGGASAGAALAASVALHGARDGVPPWQALLAYPVAHSPLPEPSLELKQKVAEMPPVLGFPQEVLEAVDLNYLGKEPAAKVEYAYVGEAEDLHVTPSTYIENAEYDDLRASGEKLGQQLQDAGVEVEVATAPGVPHGYLNAVGSPLTHESLDRFAGKLLR